MDKLKKEIADLAERARTSDRHEDKVALRWARMALSAAIVDGAQLCPKCGIEPHGIEQPRGVKQNEGPDAIVTDVEVGCLGCGARARAQSQRGAVLLWNAGEYTR